jgi:hypothetical protein
MNNMKFFHFSFFTLLVLFFSCKKTNVTKEEINVQNTIISINSCNSIATNISSFSICYDSLLFDNRCPDLAMCARRGEVAVKLSFKQNNTNIPFRLADFNSILGNFPKDTTINGVHIKLIDVLPHPFSNQNTINKVVLEVN